MRVSTEIKYVGLPRPNTPVCPCCGSREISWYHYDSCFAHPEADIPYCGECDWVGSEADEITH